MISTQNTETNKESLWKKRLKGRYSTRVLAVQCLYAISAHSKAIEKLRFCNYDEIINSIITNINTTQEPSVYRWIDQQYLIKTVQSVCQNQKSIDEKIGQFLSSNWSMNRIAKVVQCVLRAATHEILSNEAEAKAFLINDYIEIVKLFNHDGESGFANGVLDKISK
ncbi:MULTISPECIES: transcription antitermination factor NusB [unclassified Candidatus Lariskella]|uniref:transcription antitermination factor NusB n=1 Tax=unclassified Candidatus Lariskella TaxID=2632605 RepID=UPI0030CAF81B